MKVVGVLALASWLMAVACQQRAVEVAGPFYLTFIKDPHEAALFRCPNGLDEGCALDGLPGPRVVAAGANGRYVVVAQRPDSGVDGPTSYYYFARVPQESSGWGNIPEQVIGPLDESAFAAAKAKLHLPDFTARL